MNRTQKLLNVVSIGGGTGLSYVLKGLKPSVVQPSYVEAPDGKPWISRLTAVVTVSDDGGSSGKLRDELRVLPPGDIRNCLVALSADESLMSHLFQYRFTGAGGLRGHSFGNLFLTALTGVTGDFLKAIRLTSEVLAIRGRIYPSTLEDVRLVAETTSGERLDGESAISRTSARIRKIALAPRTCQPVPAVIQALRSADIITLGPGSLYTSLLPNLLVRGIAKEIRKSAALKIYIGNLMTQPGETTGFTAEDHVDAIRQHARSRLFDVIILNRKPIATAVLARYRKQGSVPVATDRGRLTERGLEIYEGDLLAQANVVRHDPRLLAKAVRASYERWRTRAAGSRLKTALV
jgi:uncharacterized cofD-like protein